MSNKQIYWTTIAIDSLQETTEFVLKIWNSKVVEILLELVDAKLEHIKSNPEIAPRILNTNFRRIIVHKHVSLFYIIESKRIKILLIWDNRQNSDDLYKKLTTANKS